MTCRRTLRLPIILAALALASWLAAAPAANARTEVVSAGALKARITESPWRLVLVGDGGRRVLSEAARGGSSATGPLGFKTLAGWHHATRAIELRRKGRGVKAILETSDPQDARLSVTVQPAGSGVIQLSSGVVGSLTPVQASGIAFRARAGERYFGFGSRSNAVNQASNEVENYVADGPNRPEDRLYPLAFVPPWAHSDRDDGTYYPVPWLLSDAGYGVLIDNDETSYYRLGEAANAWSLEAEAKELRLRFFAGPRPADALRRFTATTGRQPRPSAPWVFGPWFQTGQPNVVPLEYEAAATKALRKADAPVSAAETQMHYLPCGAHRGEQAYLEQRNGFFHSQGLAHLAYLNPSLCASYQPIYTQALTRGLLQSGPLGLPFLYPAFVGGSGPLGFTTEPLAQFDFTAPGTERFYAELVDALIADGHDGWMEDFGESTPPVAESADGTSGAQMHNRYPVDYHCAVRRIARRLGQPLTRHQRSGWTGAARCADIVWGGDPTTVWGYDGLASAVKQALSIGMSGVSRWGSDIGGYNTFGSAQNLTPELLIRWIQFGAVSGVMRTKASGLAFPSYDRPQVFEEPALPIWRRYAKLHTQLYPYLLAADRTYRRTGMPLMRHLALVAPRDDTAVARDDQFMFGPSFLAAPVTAPDQSEQEVYLPRGRWLDYWRSVRFVQGSGRFALRGVRLLRGRREATLPAPLDELPLAVRAGSLIAMLPPDVDTLAPFGRSRGLVHLKDRRRRMQLMAFPRGRTSAAFNLGERLRSRETPAGWELRIRGKRRRLYRLEATLSTLKRPLRPRRVTLDHRNVPANKWSYRGRTGVLRASFRTREGVLRVLR